MEALEPVERPLHIAVVKRLFQEVRAIRELNGGYAFQLTHKSEVIVHAAEFISHERLCCPFFGFTLVLEPEGAGLWLHITGREGVKLFIQAEFGRALVLPFPTNRDSE
jgi:hypothetical protein